MSQAESEFIVPNDRTLRMIAEAATLAAARDAAWRCRISHATPPSSAELCLGHGAVGFEAGCLNDLSSLNRRLQTAPASCVIGLPLRKDEVCLLEEVSRDTSLLLTVDHYVQAERMAQWWSRSQTPQSVLVLLQGDQPGPGIRPGQDALQLAQGIHRLPGISVAGIAVDLQSVHSADAVLQSVRHTKQQFQSSGIHCEIVHVALDVDELLLGLDEITDYTLRGLWPETAASTSSGIITTEVISRPSLDIVVTGMPSSASNRSVCVRLPEHPDAELIGRLDGCCVWTAVGSARLLTIGDPVQLQSNDRHSG